MKRLFNLLFNKNKKKWNVIIVNTTFKYGGNWTYKQAKEYSNNIDNSIVVYNNTK